MKDFDVNKPEYVVWGVPPGAVDEVPLYTLAETLTKAKQAVVILEKKGCSACRIQVIDGTDPDFVGAVKGA
jgi:hypothetical protein